mgnify:CR=1 FL=1
MVQVKEGKFEINDITQGPETDVQYETNIEVNKGNTIAKSFILQGLAEKKFNNV